MTMGSRIIFWKILFSLLVTAVLSDDSLLPTYAVPSSYSLDLILDPRATTYDGLVEIIFSQTNLDVNTVQLHASSETITIEDVLLNYQHTCKVKTVDNGTDIVTLECPTGSLGRENTLTINFKGTYDTEGMRGVYKTTYVEDDEEIVMLVTHFEPTDARRAFPCFDEPSLKAVFDIFITHPNDYEAYSNMPIMKTFSVSPDNTQVQFDTTLLMPTYIVGFVVANFVSNGDGKSRNYDDQVFSRPSAKAYTTVAATYAPTLMDLLSDWTGIAYADLGNTQAYQVAIPDFASGAMENWGLITFREVDLLDEGGTTSNSAKQRIITAIAHELSHQWFGDYVTLDWWSDTWLNEGFATYFQYYIPDQLDDNLDTMRQFIVNELQPVLLVDSVPSALSLVSDANSAVEISNKFDDISYSKGASIIWMLRNILGEKAFKEGLNSYLTTYRYSNTNPSLLLNSFSAPSSVDLSEVMKNWIYKLGFPLVTVTLDGSAVILTQERFTLQNTNETEATEWHVPISYTTSAEKKFDIDIVDWLKPNSTIEIKLDKDSWIVVNIKQSGYYRVNYDNALWHRIIMALEDDIEVIDVMNRAQMVDDIFNIARAGRISYDMVFHFAGYLKSETEYYPWVSTLNALSYISGRLNDDDAEKLLQAKILSWINKAFPSKDTKIGTGHIDKMKEVLIQDWACRLGQEECTTYVNKAFQDYKTNSKLDDYNKRGLVLCHGFRNSESPKEDYDFLFNLFKQSSSVVEQNEIISSLGCTENSEILNSYLSETISSNSSIRKQDGILVYRAVYEHGVVGVTVSLKFLEDNLEEIASRFKGMGVLPNLIIGLANRVSSDDQIDRLTKVINDNENNEEIKLIAERAIEIMTANKNWRDAHGADIKKILQEDDNASATPEPTVLFLVISFTLFYIFSNKN